MTFAPPQKPGWYVDPHNSGQHRWWDGSTWSDQVAPAPQALPVPQAHSHRQPGRRSRTVWLVAAMSALAAAAVAVVLVVVFRGNSGSSSADKQAEADVRNGVSAVEQCYADAGAYPASASASASDGGLTLSCGGSSQTIQLSADETATLTTRTDGYSLTVTAGDGVAYTYDSSTGSVVQVKG